MKINDTKLKNLYLRFEMFIKSNYPDAIVEEKKESVLIYYPGELARMIIYPSENTQGTFLIIKITRDPFRKMTQDNGIIHYLSSIDELNSVKAAAQVIMDLKIAYNSISEENSLENQSFLVPTEGQAWLITKDKKILGTIDLAFIPTNAFIHKEDHINLENINLTSQEESFIAKHDKHTIMKFFKRNK